MCFVSNISSESKTEKIQMGSIILWRIRMLPKSTTLNSDDDMTSNCTCNGRESIWVDWFALAIHTKPEVIIEFDDS